ncbi:OCIA domain-containing protein 1 [Armadillidium nasatum]|uniref:OCIA domain-containing protein 1 n=1 Tax=Armadillidium nasatum TaxID=96803 RepID=A0A5N5T1Z0_9CRUS|nr:OCIA domain-containing protein 1 [Armadillidium nasatum]
MSYNPPPNPSYYDNQSSASRPGQDNSSHGHQSGRGYVPTLTRDEIRVLKECNKESFYYRCVPLSVLFSGLAYIGMKNGYLQKSPRFGYFPKMFGGVIIGYIGGKFSYQSVCAQKIMRLQNSSLAESLRKRKGLPSYQESLVANYSWVMNPDSLMKLRWIFHKDQLTVEERRPDFSEHDEGIDSYNTVKENLSPYTENEEPWKEKKFTSYNDLRRENRKEYANKLSETHKNANSDRLSSPPPPSFPGGYSFSDSSDFGPRPDSGPTSKPEPYFNPKKNKYGDLWDD